MSLFNHVISNCDIIGGKYNWAGDAIRDATTSYCGDSFLSDFNFSSKELDITYDHVQRLIDEDESSRDKIIFNYNKEMLDICN